MLKKTLLLFFAITWTVFITILSLITLGKFGGSLAIPYKDKMVHFVFYFVFVLLWSWYRKSIHFTKRQLVIIVASAIGFGILMEALQGLFTTTRNADILDVLANSTGAFTAYLVLSKNFSNKRQL